MNETKIEWCTKSLNPVVGCTFNCPYCYARKLNDRFKWIDNWNEPKFYYERLKQLKMKKPQNIFMNSMSDIADWKQEWIDMVAVAIAENPQHNYMFLTKRIDDILYREKEFEPLLLNFNVWIGVTATTNDDLERTLPILKEIAKWNCHTFISVEPIHERIRPTHRFFGIDWIIVGAETGNRKGKVIPRKSWVKALSLARFYLHIPLFYKESMVPIVGEENMFREFPKELMLDEHNRSTHHKIKR
jgi:protein gp37